LSADRASLCRLMKNKLSQERVLEILTEAVEIEEEFVSDSLPVDLVGMNASLMCNYIQSRGRPPAGEDSTH